MPAEIPTDQTKEVLMSLADQFKALGREEGREEGRQEGRKEGRKEGRQEGREVGRDEGRADLLLNQIQLKFGAPTPAVAERVRRASAREVGQWGARILTAETLDDLFDPPANAP